MNYATFNGWVEGHAIRRAEALDAVCVLAWQDATRIPIFTRPRWLARFVARVIKLQVVHLADGSTEVWSRGVKRGTLPPPLF